MNNSVMPGWLSRTWTAVRRGLLGKSTHEYMKQFTGSDEYWDEAIAAQRGWPQSRDETPGATTHGADRNKRDSGGP